MDYIQSILSTMLIDRWSVTPHRLNEGQEFQKKGGKKVLGAWREIHLATITLGFENGGGGGYPMFINYQITAPWCHPNKSIRSIQLFFRQALTVWSLKKPTTSFIELIWGWMQDRPRSIWKNIWVIIIPKQNDSWLDQIPSKPFLWQLLEEWPWIR